MSVMACNPNSKQKSNIENSYSGKSSNEIFDYERDKILASTLTIIASSAFIVSRINWFKEGFNRAEDAEGDLLLSFPDHLPDVVQALCSKISMNLNPNNSSRNLRYDGPLPGLTIIEGDEIMRVWMLSVDILRQQTQQYCV